MQGQKKAGSNAGISQYATPTPGPPIGTPTPGVTATPVPQEMPHTGGYAGIMLPIGALAVLAGFAIRGLVPKRRSAGGH